jgi:hypothetical protein
MFTRSFPFTWVQPTVPLSSCQPPCCTLQISSCILAEIYYNCSTQAQNLQLYNNIYTQLGVSTFDQVLSREADRVLFSILALRKDP